MKIPSTSSKISGDQDRDDSPACPSNDGDLDRDYRDRENQRFPSLFIG